MTTGLTACKRSILLDSQADLLLYGMGERYRRGRGRHEQRAGHPDITFVNSTAHPHARLLRRGGRHRCRPYDELRADRHPLRRDFAVQYRNTDPFSARCLIEPYGREFVVQNPPQPPLSTQEMDDVYALPYQDTYHPSYRKAGGVPAIAEVQFSLVSNRGCFGGCSFCALTFHQGRIVQTRSHDSLLAEAARMTQHPDFEGLHPRRRRPDGQFPPACLRKQLTHGACQNRQCLFPTPCRNLRADHTDYVNLLHELRAIPGVRKVFIRSGIHALTICWPTRIRPSCANWWSTTSPASSRSRRSTFQIEVLRYMGKPRHAVYEKILPQNMPR